MLEQAESSSFKKLSECSFSELVDMKKEQFDKVLEYDDSNVGYLTNLRKMLSLQYDGIKVQIDALSKMAVSEGTSEETSQKCLSTIQSMYGILFSLEYKACAIYQKIQKLTEQRS